MWLVVAAPTIWAIKLDMSAWSCGLAAVLVLFIVGDVPEDDTDVVVAVLELVVEDAVVAEPPPSPL